MLEISTRLEEALSRAFIKVFPEDDRSSKTSDNFLVKAHTEIYPFAFSDWCTS